MAALVAFFWLLVCFRRHLKPAAGPELPLFPPTLRSPVGVSYQVCEVGVLSRNISRKKPPSRQLNALSTPNA